MLSVRRSSSEASVTSLIYSSRLFSAPEVGLNRQAAKPNVLAMTTLSRKGASASPTSSSFLYGPEPRLYQITRHLFRRARADCTHSSASLQALARERRSPGLAQACDQNAGRISPPRIRSSSSTAWRSASTAAHFARDCSVGGTMSGTMIVIAPAAWAAVTP
jgi:hypothetical protein